MGKFKFTGGVEVVCPTCGAYGRFLGRRRMVCSHLVAVDLGRYRRVEHSGGEWLVRRDMGEAEAMAEIWTYPGGPRFRTGSVIKIAGGVRSFPVRTSGVVVGDG